MNCIKMTLISCSSVRFIEALLDDSVSTSVHPPSTISLCYLRHTGVVVYGREYYFGGGIQQGQPGRTPYGTPVRVEDLGVTHVPREVFEDFLREIGPRYTPATYKLLSHNCNNFSNEAAQFLAGAAIPSYILELPNQVMNSPVGALICKGSFAF